MAFQNVQNDKDVSLILSSDAKPRLKWTPELHQRFIDAVDQLGGADKATPKGLMRVMGIHGLTLYHLKSHLQKYRLGKSQHSQSSYSQNKQEEFKEDHRSQTREEIFDGAQEQINENLQISQALQIQMEVQRKLHEQIEVQRNLQFRIEAQGKYLQTVLEKAQETLARYNSSSIGVEAAKSELSQLVSMVDTNCPSSPSMALTDMEGSLLKDAEISKEFQRNGCSLESSLTSSESSGRKDEHLGKEELKNMEIWKRDSAALSLMEMHPGHEQEESNSSSRGRKRSIETIMNENHAEQQPRRRHGNGQELQKFSFLETLDLNSQCLNDYDTGPKVLDLNCSGF